MNFAYSASLPTCRLCRRGYRTSKRNGLRGASAAAMVGASNTPVVAVKSYIGNLGAAGGPTELAASVLGLEHGLTPATLNYEEPDPACPVAVTAGAPRPATRPYVVKVSFTQMGQCGALVLRKWEG